jgi:hypothetical protein
VLAVTESARKADSLGEHKECREGRRLGETSERPGPTFRVRSPRTVQKNREDFRSGRQYGIFAELSHSLGGVTRSHA